LAVEGEHCNAVRGRSDAAFDIAAVGYRAAAEQANAAGVIADDGAAVGDDGPDRAALDAVVGIGEVERRNPETRTADIAAVGDVGRTAADDNAAVGRDTSTGRSVTSDHASVGDGQTRPVAF